MLKEFLILENGGIMSAEQYERHNRTVAHYNKLADLLRTKREGTTEYINIFNKLRTLQVYIQRDLKDAQARADKMINK
jgi:hypothetical protein